MNPDERALGRAGISRRAEQPASHTVTSTTRYVALGSQTERDFGLSSTSWRRPPDGPARTTTEHSARPSTSWTVSSTS